MSAMSASTRATLELANLEMEAKSTAKKKVANLLQVLLFKLFYFNGIC